MRMLARSYVWWPSIDECIHKLVSLCDVCQSMQNEPAKRHIHPLSQRSLKIFVMIMVFAM